MIRIGEKNSFIVMRKSDLGYMLSNKADQVLLHFNQSLNQELEMNSIVECFVQYDSRGRIAATLEEPTATVTKPGWAEVVEVNPRLGVFVSIHTFKDILISRDVLPEDAHFWPEVGDKLFVKLTHKAPHLNAMLVNKSELLAIHPEIPELSLGTKVTAHVARASSVAVNAITDDLNYVYVSSKQFRGSYRIGETVEIMIIGRHEDELVGSLNKVKEEMVPEDEKVIMDYLNSHDGQMPLTAKTDSETIESLFHMSRKAFKRALGDLYKNRKIYFEEDKTYLAKE